MTNLLYISSLLLLLTFNLKAQIRYDIQDIRNFNYSLMVSLSDNKFEKIQFHDYGEVRHQNNTNSKFLFQNQEFEPYLGLYLLQSRIYSPLEKRFFQPDPQSQYSSPYLFVASDPINIIDLNGQDGKPLILYGEDELKANPDFRDMMEDIKFQFKDAYHYPISDFLNGEIGDLPEWEGDVMINAHMGATPGSEIEVERLKPKQLNWKSNSDYLDYFPKTSMNEAHVSISAEGMGAHLREFAEARRVPIRNVFAGGCQGRFAAEGIAHGYVNAPLKKPSILKEMHPEGLKISTFGVNKNLAVRPFGPFGVKRFFPGKGASATRWYVYPNDREFAPYYTGKGDQRKFRGFKGLKDKSPPIEMPFIEGQQINELPSGRVAEDIEDLVKGFHLDY